MKIEDYGTFGVYSYRRPTGHTKTGARHRGETPLVTEWGFVRKSADGLSWQIGKAVPGFASKENAIEAAKKS